MRVGALMLLRRWLEHLHNGLRPHRGNIIPYFERKGKIGFPVAG